MQGLGLRMILVKTEAEALDLRARIDKRESFEELARKYSIDSSASAGGFLGVLNLTDLRQEFRDSLSGVHPGETSRIIKLSEGYALLQLLTETETQWQTQNDAALQFFKQERFRDAEVSLLAAIQAAEHFGSLDARLVTSLDNLAQVYHAQKNYDAAEPLYKRALDIKEKMLGADDPDIGASMINLAALYRDQGNTAAAVPLYQRALEIAEKAFGPENSNVVASIVNLAGLYHDQENYAAAEPLYKRALAVQEKTLGPEHPDVAISLVSLAELYQDQEKFAMAEPLYRRALAIDEKTFGPNDPNVGISMSNLALVEENLGN